MKPRGAIMGLVTALGLARRGFFIPYRYAGRLPDPGENRGYPALETLLHEHEPDFAAFLGGMTRFAGDFAAIGKEPPPHPRWTQDWFPRLDAAVAYALVRLEQPRRIVEVGSGHSTRFLARAVSDGALACSIAAIDPAPRAGLDRLEAIEPLRTTVQNAGMAPFQALASGDVLFVDSSHILMPGTDVDHLLNRVLPALPAGVLVHIHDIFLPDDYPAQWAWRGYNEQLGLAAALLGGAFEPIFASHYVATRMPEALAASAVAALPLMPGALESSLWLRKR